MPIQPFNPTYPFTDDKLAQLKQIVPEAFEDGRLNFETLREVLEPNLDPEGTVSDDSERFGLLWPGKKEARRLAAIPSKGTLAPVYGQGLKADGTPDTDGTNDSRNVFIEGENLEVLKIMQKAYAGRIKMIYIDPPYNTGNDFVYDDNFTEPLEHYLRRTGQIDDEGQKLTTNTKSDGRFHSKWLSMMYPRLRLARNLLREDGVIFVSIDDNEVHNLRQLMNEVFGEENFVAEVATVNNRKGRVLDKHISTSHEYLLIFSKDELPYEMQVEKPKDEIKKNYKLEDEGGPYRLMELRNTHREFNSETRPNLCYPLYADPETGEVYAQKRDNTIEILPTWNDGFIGCWTWGLDLVKKKRELLLAKYVSDTWKVYRKSYAYSDGLALKNLKSVWNKLEFLTEKGQKDFSQFFDGKKVFQAPKSIDYLKTMIELTRSEDDIILDFFAGSGSTGHAVIDYNRQKGFTNRFICIQLPEKVDSQSIAGKRGFSKISSISHERLRRLIDSIDQKTGFRSFSYSPSQVSSDVDFALDDLFDFTEKSYNPTHLLWEVALAEGFPLDSRVAERRVGEQTVYTLTSDFHGFALHCCFDETIAPAAAPEMPLGENDVLVCLDRALDDQTKLRLSDKGLLKTI